MRNLQFCIVCLFLVFTPVFAGEMPEINVYIAKYKGDKTCAISYTFDDGLREHYTLAAPVFNKYGFKGTFWVNGSKVNEQENSLKDTTHVCWEGLKEMAMNGHEISNHGWRHRKLISIPPEEAKVEIQRNDTLIFEKIGIFPRTFCYPYNARNEEIIEMASKDRVGTRTKQFSMGCKSTPGSLDKRINELLRDEEWGVAMIHGLTYGYDKFTSVSIFWNHLEKVKELEDKIWVGTFREVVSYIKERENTELQIVKKSDTCFQIIPTCSLDKELFIEPLTAVLEKGDLQSICVTQDNIELSVQLKKDKFLFDFNPFGGVIKIQIQ